MTSSLRLAARPGPLLLFVVLAAGLVATEHYAVHRPDLARLPLLPPAVEFDLLVVLPGLFYVLVVRRYRLPLRTVAAAFGGGLALSHWLLPAGGLPVLAWAGRLAQVLELLTLGYAVGRLRRIRRGYRAAQRHSADFMDNLLAAGQPVLGRCNELLMTEVAVLHYGLLGHGAAVEVGAGEQAFSSHQKSGFGALLAALGGLSMVEMAAAHLVLAHWYPRLAWGLTVASAYGLLWLLAHGQAVRRRPVLVAGRALKLRVGFCYRATLAISQIAAIQEIKDAPPAAPGLLNAAKLLLTPPNLLLRLAAPQVVQGPFGQRRLVSRLALYVDEPGALRQLLQSQVA